ncbi:MAG: AraC family transcriptional regulator [Spartobacteria bacterium]|nr:AraC family transcriptional regulator [Spartobacteria bacterium]
MKSGKNSRPDTYFRRKKLVEDAKKLINEQIGAKISLSGLSAQLNVSSGHFSRIFKTIAGLSFSDYVANERMKLACRMIAQQSDIRIKTVSHTVGFKNSDHFCAWFRQNQGISPSEYRAIAMKSSFPR